jgi:hypothetical protein
LEPFRTSVIISGSFGSKLGKGFQNSERARRDDSSHIYILLEFEDILFFVIIPFLKLKTILEKYFEGSENSRKIPRHNLAPNERKSIFRSFKKFLSTSNK